MWRSDFNPDSARLKERAASHHRDVADRAQSSMAPQEAASKHVPQQNSGQVRRRIVPCEVGMKTLREIESMSEVFHHLADVVRGVALFDDYGWERFDISVESVLVVEEKVQKSDQSWTVEKRVKISDLDYAKRLEDGQAQLQPLICTGTNCFTISTEVEERQYQHWKGPIPEMEDSDAEGEDWRLGPQAPPRPAVKKKPREHKPPFRHNILHDGESVFWLALYLLLMCVLARRGKDGALVAHGADAGYQEAQRAFAREVFASRFQAMVTDSTFLRRDVARLDPRVRWALHELDEMRKQIRKTHEVAESKLHEPPHTLVLDDQMWNPQRLLHAMATRFWQISRDLEDDDVLVVTNPGASREVDDTFEARHRWIVHI